MICQCKSLHCGICGNQVDESVKLLEELNTYRHALEKIADPRKKDHIEPDAYTELGCVMQIAQDALDKHDPDRTPN